MLPLFRRKKEWLKWVLLGVILILGLSTVLLFVDTPRGIGGGGIGLQEVAVVAGQPITSAEFGRYYRRLMDMYRQMYNLNESNSALLRQLGIGQQALNQLIQQQSAVYAAQEMGLRVGDDELAAEIARLFSENGVFIGTERYRQILLSNNLTTREFEESVRRDLLGQKLRNIVTDGIVATPEEVRREFMEANQEVRVRYVGFSTEEVDPGSVDDARLRTWFQEKQENYRIEEQRQVAYVEVYVPPTDVQVSEEQIQAEMSTAPTEEQVHARHILIRFDSDVQGDEERARRKAQDLLNQLRQGADFAELARQHSEDAASAVRGGDLGFFGRGQMVPEFENTAFTLQPNAISELVRTVYGYHIIQTLEKSGGTAEGNRPAAVMAARSKEADRQAREKAQQLAAAAKTGTRLEDAAGALGLTVKTSPPFDRIQGVPGINAGPDFTAAVFAAPVGGIVGPTGGNFRYLVGRVENIQPSRIPSFEEVRDKVLEAYLQEQRDTLTLDRATAFLQKAREAGSLEAAAKAAGLKVYETPMFRKGSTIDENLKFSPEVHDQAFALPVGGLGGPVRVTNQYFVLEVAEKSPFDEGRFNREKDQLAEQLTQRRRSEFYSAFVQNVVDRLRREEKIVINQRLVDDLTG